MLSAVKFHGLIPPNANCFEVHLDFRTLSVLSSFEMHKFVDSIETNIGNRTELSKLDKVCWTFGPVTSNFS